MNQLWFTYLLPPGDNRMDRFLYNIITVQSE